ncbi:twin-arginine translocase TatA/TatE family subunit [Kribbella jiaozuonensis]|uniref:Sec-independent protein translocase protein TatA n=1 Tax=Kribbella jiaozuonensis TaxID=2575441 RepID=A0A4U3M265_9ACTN|nr:twin-arginine translocase TatA/TatE family subunit [Kribbella jiaozuonensis]TKK82262.1 twin-arginine translocase TatA/TatE family subunit [Kribbella jiaozuonensis]
MVPLLALPEGGEWIVILVIVVLLFGAKKLPELTKNAARAMKEFEKVRNGDDDETPAQVTAPPQAQPQAPAQPVQTQAPQAPAAPPQAAPAQPTDVQPTRPTDTEGGTAQ